jgi:hypothetical protein
LHFGFHIPLMTRLVWGLDMQKDEILVLQGLERVLDLTSVIGVASPWRQAR